MTASLLPTAQAGDYRATLEALRDCLAASIDQAVEQSPALIAGLARQLADVLDRLAALPVADAAADDVESAQASLHELPVRLVR